MKHFFIILGTLLYSFPGIAQIHEIDRLCDKYKNNSNIIIYSTFGDVVAHVSIDKNGDNLPYAITLAGQTNNIEALSEIAYNILKGKENQGFKYYSGDNINEAILDQNTIKLVVESEIIKYKLSKLDFVQWNGTIDLSMKVAEFKTVYKKGNLYFYMHLLRNKYNAPTDPLQLSPYGNVSFDRIQFEITNGDNSRKGGNKAQVLDF